MKTVRATVRLIMFVTATLGLYAIWFVSRVFVPNKVYWRQVVFGLWTQSFVRITKMRIEVVGKPPKPPFFLVTNHVSYTDIAAIRQVVTGVFVAKAEVEGWFLVGRICRDMGTIFIDRTNRRDIPRAGEKIVERLDSGEGVIVFPEGTSTRGDTVLSFNSSFLEFAARRDIPVSYASLSYSTPSDEMPASLAVCWWEDISFMAHLRRLLSITEYTAVLTFGDEPIRDPDRKQLANELRQRVAETFIPIT